MSIEPDDRADRRGDPPPTVMVVEDFTPLRMLCTRLLEREGYAVVTAATADAALDLLADGVAPDVVVTDLNLPGERTGHDLVAQLRRVHPTIGVVVVTGTVGEEFTAYERVAVVGKPFDNRDLVGIVAHMLAV